MMLALTNGVTHFRCKPSVTATLLEKNQLRGTSIEDGAQDHDPAFLGDAAFVVGANVPRMNSASRGKERICKRVKPAGMGR